jgi:hypothetical protein
LLLESKFGEVFWKRKIVAIIQPVGVQQITLILMMRMLILNKMTRKHRLERHTVKEQSMQQLRVEQ